MYILISGFLLDVISMCYMQFNDQTVYYKQYATTYCVS